MNKVWILLYLLTTVFVQATVQKMILSANVKTEDAAKDLYTIEKFFQENKIAKVLQTKHGLTTQMELLDTYVIVTIRPIRNTTVKNKLYYVIQEHFPESFIVDDTPVAPILSSPKINKEIKTVKKAKITEIKREKASAKMREKKSETSTYDDLKLFWSNLESEWIALLFLALAGFLLIYRSNRQISKIRTLQKEVELYQNKIENDIEGMGENR